MAQELDFSDSDVAGASGDDAPSTSAPATPKRTKALPKSSGSKTKQPRRSPKKRADRHKAAVTKKGWRVCKACMKNLETSLFAINQNNCMQCKRFLDVLSRKARAQNKMDWFNEVGQSPQKLKALVNAYGAAVEDAKKAGNRKANFNLVQYIEEVRASSAVGSINRGKMMWMDQALNYWCSVEGGAYTKQAATAKWEQLVADIGVAEDVITDELGPPHSKLRIRTATDDEVNFEDSYERSKHLG